MRVLSSVFTFFAHYKISVITLASFYIFSWMCSDRG